MKAWTCTCVCVCASSESVNRKNRVNKKKQHAMVRELIWVGLCWVSCCPAVSGSFVCQHVLWCSSWFSACDDQFVCLSMCVDLAYISDGEDCEDETRAPSSNYQWNVIETRDWCGGSTHRLPQPRSWPLRLFRHSLYSRVSSQQTATFIRGKGDEMILTFVFRLQWYAHIDIDTQSLMHEFAFTCWDRGIKTEMTTDWLCVIRPNVPDCGQWRWWRVSEWERGREREREQRLSECAWMSLQITGATDWAWEGDNESSFAQIVGCIFLSWWG